MEKVILICIGQTDYGFAMANKRDYAFKREPQIGLGSLTQLAGMQRTLGMQH